MTSPTALHQAQSLRERAQEVVRGPWDQLGASDLPDAAALLAQARSLIDAALLTLTDRLETTRAAEKLGWASTKDFLTHITGGHKGSGGGLVRAVEQLRDLPAVGDALNEGAITLPQARAIAGKVAALPRLPEFREAVANELLDLVATKWYGATELQNVFGDVVHQLDPDRKIRGDDEKKDRTERGAHHARYLALSPDDFGGMKLRGYGTAEDAERIKTVLMSLSAPVTTEPGSCGGRARRPDEPWYDENGHRTTSPCPDPHCGHNGRDPRDHGKRMWDALVDACDQLRATGHLPRDHGSTPRVMVLIDQESLKQQVIDAGLAGDGHLPSGEPISVGAIRRLACDAEIIPAVLGSDGQVLDVGRANRLVTPAIWSALVIRDQHCAFPGCTRLPLACDAHHIVHWADGGATSLDNLVMLCRRHHVLTHRTPWTVHIDRHRGKPVWTAPPRTDRQGRITYVPAQRRDPLVA